MPETKINRFRNKAITIRLSDVEYTTLLKRIEASGLSQQSFIINAIKETPIVPASEIDTLKDISETFNNLTLQLRGLATNVNQLAHIANSHGSIPTEYKLSELLNEIELYRKESDTIWQLIRSSIHQPKATEQ